MPRYALYLRKSRSDDPDKSVEETLRRHREILERYAVENGINLAPQDIYEEVVSGESLYSRPEMLRLLEAVESGRYSGVLCMDIDRLGRGKTSDQGIILETFKYSDTKIITPNRQYDLNNEFDEDYAEFEGFMAHRELKMIKRRMQRGIQKTIEEGGYLANAPYGYVSAKIGKKPSLAINEDEAPFVRMIIFAAETKPGGKFTQPFYDRLPYGELPFRFVCRLLFGSNIKQFGVFGYGRFHFFAHTLSLLESSQNCTSVRSRMMIISTMPSAEQYE